MRIQLEQVGESVTPYVFRIAFCESSERILLPYPDVTGLTFCDASGNQVAEWGTSALVISPQDDFVLNPAARIAFDLHACINTKETCSLWSIEIPTGKYQVHYFFEVARNADWYDFLQKRSRFVDMTPIWRGQVRSNSIEFNIAPSP